MPRRVAPEVEAEIVRRWLAGDLIKVIAYDAGVTDCTIHACLRRQGVAVRRRRRVASAVILEAKRRRRAGQSWPSIASALGTARTTIQRHVGREL